MANSAYIAERIRKVWRRESLVVHPPVDLEALRAAAGRERTAGRAGPLRRRLAPGALQAGRPGGRGVPRHAGAPPARAGRRAGDEAGRGSGGGRAEHRAARPGSAGRSWCRPSAAARAFVFAAEEDFGIAMVEAQACGTPVIAYGKGGARDILRGPSHPAPTGLLLRRAVGAVHRRRGGAVRGAVARDRRRRLPGERAAVQPRALPGRDAPGRRAAPARKAAMLFSLIMATRGRTGEVGEFLDCLLAQGARRRRGDRGGPERRRPARPGHRALRRTPAAPVAPVGPRQRLPCAQPRPVAGARARSSASRTMTAPIRRACWRGWTRPSQPIPRCQVLTGPAASPAGGLGSGRWRRDGGPITAANVWTSVIEFNLFLRRDTALALGGFDERARPRHAASARPRATTSCCAPSRPGTRRCTTRSCAWCIPTSG